jgi:hypothetical protein
MAYFTTDFVVAIGKYDLLKGETACYYLGMKAAH